MVKKKTTLTSTTGINNDAPEDFVSIRASLTQKLSVFLVAEMLSKVIFLDVFFCIQLGIEVTMTFLNRPIIVTFTGISPTLNNLEPIRKEETARFLQSSVCKDLSIPLNSRLGIPASPLFRRSRVICHPIKLLVFIYYQILNPLG